MDLGVRAPITIRRTRIDSVDWLIRDLGPRRDTPDVVFVAGLGSGEYLCPHAERLADTRHVLVPDMPGFGRSRGARRLRSVEEFANALSDLLRHEVAGPTDLIGNSFGTQIVLAFAQTRPDLVRRLVLVGPTIDRQARSYPRAFGRWLCTAPIEPPSLAVSLARSYLRCGLRTPALAFRASMQDRPEQRIRAIDHPVLLVRGTHDRIAPRRWLEELQRAGDDVEIAEIPNAAHTVDYSAPVEVAEIVARFLARPERM